MIVRPAIKSELLDAFTIFKEFENCSELVKVEPKRCTETYTRFIEQEIGGLLLGIEGTVLCGGLGYVIADDLHCYKKYAIETFWLMLPDRRGNGMMLVEEFEKIAVERDCDECAMIHLVDSFPKALNRLYRMRGYKLIENHHVKRLKL